MPKHYITDSSMDEEMSHCSYHSGASSVRSGPAAYCGNNYDHRRPPYYPTGNSYMSDRSDVSLKRDREREGRCSECGVQTHEFRIDAMTGSHVKVPMTVENEVHRGRCLLCYPIPLTCGRSSRSLATISTLGNSSAPGNFHRPELVGSSPTVVTNSSADTALQRMHEDSCDLLELLTSMRRFPNERLIQEKGLEKLWVDAFDDDNSIAIGRVGGIGTILQSMNSFVNVAKVQQYGCEALQNLALNEYNRDFMGENGGIAAVVQAMNAHRDVVGVQQAGCTALANLAASREQHVDIANTGGLHAIVHAAQTYSNQEDVLRAAYQALRALGYDPQRHGSQTQQAREAQQSQEEDSEETASTDMQQEEDDDEGESSSGDEIKPTPAQGQQVNTRESRNVIRLDAYGFPISN